MWEAEMGGLQFKDSKAKTKVNKTLSQKTSQIRWLKAIISATQEAEVGGSHLRLAQTKV
jgi:hypothetical protein